MSLFQVSRRVILGGASIATLAAAALAVQPGTPSARAKSPIAVGQPAPDFAVQDTHGKPVKLSDLKGRTVVLEWTNHDCPYVVKHYATGTMQALQKDATKDGVVWLSIISSSPGEQGFVSPPTANDLTKSRSAAPTAVLLDPDGRIGRDYDARTTPHMFIVDKAGVLRYMGGIDDKPSSATRDIAQAKPYVRLALASLAKGETIAAAVTKPYGCSVKYK